MCCGKLSTIKNYSNNNLATKKRIHVNNFSGLILCVWLFFFSLIIKVACCAKIIKNKDKIDQLLIGTAVQVFMHKNLKTIGDHDLLGICQFFLLL